MKISFLLTACLLALTGKAQLKHIDPNQANNISFACNFFDKNTQYVPVPAAAVSDAAAEKWMAEMVDKITNVVGLKNRFRLVSLKKYNNCSAVCFNNNIGQERFIQFDRDFLEAFQKKTNNKWFVVGVLAHELGHHFNGHSLDGIGSRPDKEIEADEFAGFILQKLGASFEESRGIFSFLNETDGPPTHPVRYKRYAAVGKGWDRAAGKNIWVSLALENDADKKEIAYQKLLDARKEFDPAKKIVLIDEALKKVPGYAEAISEKGLVYLNLKQYQQAEDFCVQALLLEPYIGLLRLNLAKVCYAQKQYDTAMQFVNDAIFINPIFPDAYHLRAQLQLDNRSFQQAVSDCNVALLMRPANNYVKAEILGTKGMALDQLQQKAAAQECFQEAKKLNPLSLRLLQYQQTKKIN